MFEKLAPILLVCFFNICVIRAAGARADTFKILSRGGRRDHLNQIHLKKASASARAVRNHPCAVPERVGDAASGPSSPVCGAKKFR